MSDNGRRVMVTGIGLMTAIGQGAAPTWHNLLEGRIGIGPIQSYDPAPLQTKIGAEIHDFDPTQWASRRTLRMLCRGDQLALAAAVLALRDAGLEDTGDLGHRTGLFLGSNKEMPRMDELISQLQSVRAPDGTPDLRTLGQNASSIVAPLFFVEGLQPAAGFHISEKFGIRGANAYFAGTADSGAMAVGRAMRTVRRGEADIVVAGGYDDATGWWAMSKMDGLGVLSPHSERGKEAFRPFDRDRSGSVFGEGAALLVLEEREHALARGAHCYAEVTGFGSGNDCVRPPSPQARARGLSRAVTRALTDAGGSFNDGSYIAAHGCATRQGDASETIALHDALGTAAKAAQISSVKPQTGHLVGGAGALNAAIAALTLDSGVVPATQNLTHPAAECDLDYVPLTPRETRPAQALAVARGLEGQAVAIAMERTS
ncbi:beta-ketoacyl-[acyl-carrier-protein] synthase family protein [Streptomyces sp. NPDC086787]|uniref:beta-ketoacyl-[acyl-carrier-protein] synthase family protein n=1 Tax=Streptomyces sp. NPDC086787 TaxID=3365759 RepID=UPI00381E8A0C